MGAIQQEHPGKLAAMSKCAHDGCICTVASVERFCSDYCARQATPDALPDDECRCGHSECVHHAAAPVVPGGLVAS